MLSHRPLTPFHLQHRPSPEDPHALSSLSSLFTSPRPAPQIGQAIAKGDADTAKDTASQALTLALVCGLASALLLEATAEPVVRAFLEKGSASGIEPATPDEAVSAAIAYIRVRALGLPAALVGAAAGGAYRGLLDTRTPLVLAVVSNAVNAALDPLLIFGPSTVLGAMGASLPTLPLPDASSAALSALVSGATHLDVAQVAGENVASVASGAAGERLWTAGQGSETSGGGFGAAGAAAATVVSEYVGCGLALRGLTQSRLGNLSRIGRMPDAASLAPLLTASAALLVRQGALQGSLLLATATVARWAGAVVCVTAAILCIYALSS